MSTEPAPRTPTSPPQTPSTPRARDGTQLCSICRTLPAAAFSAHKPNPRCATCELALMRILKRQPAAHTCPECSRPRRGAETVMMMGSSRPGSCLHKFCGACVRARRLTRQDEHGDAIMTCPTCGRRVWEMIEFTPNPGQPVNFVLHHFGKRRVPFDVRKRLDIVDLARVAREPGAGGAGKEGLGVIMEEVPQGV